MYEIMKQLSILMLVFSLVCEVNIAQNSELNKASL